MRSFRRMSRLWKPSSPFSDRQEIGVETLMLVADNTGVVGFIRAKSFFFPHSAGRAVARLPEILALSGRHPAPGRVLPRQTPPDLHARIRRPPPSRRIDPVAPCLGDASVNVQGWSVAGQFSTVTTAFLNFLKQKRYFHEQRNNQSVDNP